MKFPNFLLTILLLISLLEKAHSQTSGVLVWYQTAQNSELPQMGFWQDIGVCEVPLISVIGGSETEDAASDLYSVNYHPALHFSDVNEEYRIEYLLLQVLNLQ